MNAIFGTDIGKVGVFASNGALPFAIAVGGNDDVPGFEYVGLAKAILTGFDLTGASGLTADYSLDDKIYVYLFGERAGEAVVSGVAFAGVCDNAGGGAGDYTGFDAIYSYYETVRASSQGAACQLVFGNRTVLSGFMKGLQFRLEDPGSGLGSFQFLFLAMPRVYAPPLVWLESSDGAGDGTGDGTGDDTESDPAPTP